jgi:hypothetical protein
VAEILGVSPTAECFANLGFDLHVGKYLDIYGVKWNIQILNNMLAGTILVGKLLAGSIGWKQSE